MDHQWQAVKLKCAPLHARRSREGGVVVVVLLWRRQWRTSLFDCYVCAKPEKYMNSSDGGSKDIWDEAACLESMQTHEEPPTPHTHTHTYNCKKLPVPQVIFIPD